MALALNNLKRVDMPLNKETKPNQTIPESSAEHDKDSMRIDETPQYLKICT